MQDDGLYLLVRVNDRKFKVAVELCKDFEEYDGVETAIIVRRGSAHSAGIASYLGEFYSTPQAIERILA